MASEGIGPVQIARPIVDAGDPSSRPQVLVLLPVASPPSWRRNGAPATTAHILSEPGILDRCAFERFSGPE
ncbi:hypothetical protein GGTG_02691 [Gaeumannomyces tritici R3-111a-1]|uniref:Uncharacterized protein n=1 Tax=Gaeumannomyces tritici (strain R3-111a-1) TaxID=644352 RepID=J3NN33_GAET3|nr:hypothetical protein GGTG_02691 [Gaeumannomyces tritici R3-111a-1]EJT77585.1 hypothetical protein GGTG_02691 [Gaeumannomyces tritici R3-111a-1]